MNDKKINAQLSKRLLSIAQLVREDTELIDIGTDHGYLPVSLVLSGKIKNAVAADIAEGPLSKAKKYIAQNGLSHKIKTVLSNGFQNVSIDSSCCDAIIAGMGGELIAEIIGTEPRLKDGRIRLILQPMTKAEYLRKFLSDNGFLIDFERLADEKKIYQIICCHYIGKSYSLSDSELLLGKLECIVKNSVFKKFLTEKYDLLQKIAFGKSLAGLDTEYENNLLNCIDRMMIEYECKTVI